MVGAPLDRLVGECLREQLDVMPAVVVTGARQTGKTTLVTELAPGPRRYISFDAREGVAVAWREPEVLAGRSGPVTLDEAQREPAALDAVNRAIDLRGMPGMFLLTELASVLRLRRVVEPRTAGVVHLTLWPMTRREQKGLGSGGIWDELLDTDDALWLELVADQPNEPEDWQELALRGGLPVPALELRTPEERAAWFDDYVRTYLERELFFDGYLYTFGRELQDLSAFGQLEDFRELLRIMSAELGQRVSQRALSAGPRIREYLDLLVSSLTLVSLPAYPPGRTRNHPMSSRLYWADTGLALHLAQTSPTGVHLQNLVLGDLLAWRDSRIPQAGLSYWGTMSGQAVDFVLEAGRGLLPITVTTTTQPRVQDIGGLCAFRAEHPEASRSGLLLHTGNDVEWLAPGVLAAPWWRIL